MQVFFCFQTYHSVSFNAIKIAFMMLFQIDLYHLSVLFCNFKYWRLLGGLIRHISATQKVNGFSCYESEGNRTKEDRMSFGPMFLLDKSTLQGLSFDCIVMLMRYYRQPIPPILLRELTSDLAKEERGNT